MKSGLATSTYPNAKILSNDAKTSIFTFYHVKKAYYHFYKNSPVVCLCLSVFVCLFVFVCLSVYVCLYVSVCMCLSVCVQCAVCNVQCAVCSVQCAVCSVQYPDGLPGLGGQQGGQLATPVHLEKAPGQGGKVPALAVSILAPSSVSSLVSSLVSLNYLTGPP